MIVIEVIMRTALFAVLLCAAWQAVEWVVRRLDAANRTIDEAPRIVDARRVKGHQPLYTIGVAVQCGCGFSHVAGIDSAALPSRVILSAYRAAQDEFWATHIQEVAA